MTPGSRKINLVNVIFSYLILDLSMDGSAGLRCYKCASSNLNRDLNCQVEQNNKAYLKECSAEQSTCVLVHYKGIDPKTGSRFYNIIRECSKSNSTGCTTKKRTSLTAKTCFCKNDACNDENGSRGMRATGLVQLALLLSAVLLARRYWVFE